MFRAACNDQYIPMYVLPVLPVCVNECLYIYMLCNRRTVFPVVYINTHVQRLTFVFSVIPPVYLLTLC